MAELIEDLADSKTIWVTGCGLICGELPRPRQLMGKDTSQLQLGPGLRVWTQWVVHWLTLTALFLGWTQGSNCFTSWHLNSPLVTDCDTELKVKVNSFSYKLHCESILSQQR